jgi:uncharacterized membrane protein
MSASVPLDVIVLSLVPAVVWGFTPIIAKRGIAAGGNTLQGTTVDLIVDTGLFVLLLSTLGGGVAGLAALSLETVAVFVFAGAVGTTVGRLGTFVGVDRLGASIASAGLSSRPLFAFAMGVVLLGERPTLWVGVGILVLCAGLVVLSLSGGGDASGWETWALVFPLVAAFSFAVGNVARSYGMVGTPATILQATTVNEAAALVAFLGFVAVRTDWETFDVPRRSYAYFSVHGALEVVATVALFEAFDRGGNVSIVDPLYATAPLFTVVFAAVLLRDLERVTVRSVLGALLVVAGAVAITM